MNIFYEVWTSGSLAERILNVLSIIALIVGIAGNVTVCIVIWNSRSIYTITNVYLLSLSIADLLFLTVHILRETCYYANYSKIKVETYVAPDDGFYICLWIFKTAKNASAFTMTAFTSERYLAICHPFKIQTMPKKSRPRMILTILWIVAALLSFNAVSFAYILNKSSYVEGKQVIKKIGLHFEFILTSLNFVIPVILITVMYILIGLELKKSSKMRKISTRTDVDATKKALKMFVFIVAAFVFCWAPYYISMVLKTALFTGHNIFGETSEVVSSCESIQKFTRTAYPALNPLIYALMSQKFRKVCKDQITRTRRKLSSSTFSTVNTRLNENTMETVS